MTRVFGTAATLLTAATIAVVTVPGLAQAQTNETPLPVFIDLTLDNGDEGDAAIGDITFVLLREGTRIDAGHDPSTEPCTADPVSDRTQWLELRDPDTVAETLNSINIVMPVDYAVTTFDCSAIAGSAADGLGNGTGAGDTDIQCAATVTYVPPIDIPPVDTDPPVETTTTTGSNSTFTFGWIALATVLVGIVAIIASSRRPTTR